MVSPFSLCHVSWVWALGLRSLASGEVLELAVGMVLMMLTFHYQGTDGVRTGVMRVMVVTGRLFFQKNKLTNSKFEFKT